MGVTSQGICFPLSIVGGGYDSDIPCVEGEDVTEKLKVKLYSPPIPASLSGQVKGQFPSFIPRTDELRNQSVPGVLERHKGKKMFCTEKLDGASTSMFIKDGVFGVCSRNLELLETKGNTLWEVAKKYDIENKLRALNRNICLQGEICGNGIQKNPYKLKDQDVFFFSIFDIDAYKYLDYDEMKSVIMSMQLKSVPQVECITLNHTVDELVEMAKGKSALSDSLREGIVVRPLIEERDSELGRLSFKVINQEYLLSEED
jgi:RNA ligase (TIGR02306 family)